MVSNKKYRRRRMELSKDLFDDVPVHIGQLKTTPLVNERKLLMVDPELVKNRRLQIMHVHRPFGESARFWIDRVSIRVSNIVTVIIGATVSHARLHAASRHPNAETT